jgi:hypothetical protein
VKGTEPINHALFVDDSLLLGGASLRIARAFNEIIQNFCCISGALVNKRKSVVYGWNTNEQTISRIAHILGFKGFVSWDKIKYLGLPLTLGANKSSLWMEVISKFKSKIVAWGGQWLNNAGKLILIKAVLTSLPLYQASFLLAPKAITEQISKLIRDFLWRGGKGNQSKFHLVSWDIAKRPKREGGLQIRDPSLANIILGGKILWQMYSNRSHPVSLLLQKKYLKGTSLRNFQNDNTPKGTPLWNLCRKGLEFFKKQLFRVPGNGKRTLLWTDSIMGKPPLENAVELTEIRVWLSQLGLKSLADISAWDNDGFLGGLGIP